MTRRERIEAYMYNEDHGWKFDPDVSAELRALWKVVDAASDDTATQAGWSRFVDALDEYKAGQDD